MWIDSVERNIKEAKINSRTSFKFEFNTSFNYISEIIENSIQVSF